jgi:enoyl-CoA hydratase/carnithine racemase
MLPLFSRVIRSTASILPRYFSTDAPACSLLFPHPGIAVVQLNKPESRNALSRAMLAQLAAALSDVRAQPTLRAVVIWGGPSCFCAGADLVERRGMDEAQVPRCLTMRKRCLFRSLL